MLDRLVKFFQSIFSFLAGGSDKKEDTNPPPTSSTNPTPLPEFIPVTEEELPEIEEVEPQDGSDIPLEKEQEDIVLINAEVEDLPIEESTQPTDDNNTSTNEIPIEEPTPKHEPRYLWILDNGHGKDTKGKRSPKFNDGKRLFEYEFNRAIVKKIIESLDKEGVKYHNLVPEENVGNILKTRVARANALKVKSDLPSVYVSVHANAGPENQGDWSSAKGIETWYYRTSLDGRKIAKIFQKHLIANTGWVNRDAVSYTHLTLPTICSV